MPSVAEKFPEFAQPEMSINEMSDGRPPRFGAVLPLRPEELPIDAAVRLRLGAK